MLNDTDDTLPPAFDAANDVATDPPAGGDAAPIPEEPRHFFTRPLRVTLTSDERHARADSMVALHEERATVVAAKKEATAEFGGKLKKIDTRIAELAASIGRRSELREMQCYEQWNNGVMEIRRADTDEVIDTRMPSLFERPRAVVDAGDGADGEDDFGGQQARKAKEAEDAAATEGGVEKPVGDPTGNAKPAKPAKKAGAKKSKAKRK